MKHKKITTQIFIDDAIATHGDKYDYSLVNYINNKTKVEIICKECKTHFFKSRVNHITNNQGCPNCSNKKMSQNNTLSQDEVITKFRNIHGDKYDYSLVKYINMKSNIKIKCNNCSKIFERLPLHHLKRHACPNCERIDSIDKFIDKSKEIFGDRYDYSKFNYINAITKSELICKKHDNEVSVTPNNHIHSRFGGCSKCLEDHKRIPFSEFIRISGDRHMKAFGIQYDYSLIKESDYRGITRDKVPIVCSKHGKFTQAIFDHYVMLNGCPKCGNRKSRLEDFIEEFLMGHNILFKQNTKSLISPLELDFIIPEYKIAIEVNGLRYHTEGMGKDSKYHKNKMIKCEEVGYRLIHINEDEITHKPRVVISKLRSIFKVKKRGIYARKCEVREITREEKSKFLKKYHLQGNDRSSKYLGLFYKNRLVSVMTFSKMQGKNYKPMNVNGYFTLSRYCGNFNFYILGGASKLLKYFERNYDVNYLRSYADLRWSDGGLYNVLGFIHNETNPPNYRVTTGKYPYVTFHKRGFQRTALKRMFKNYNRHETEVKNLQNNGYDRIWDCGLMVFEKKYTDGSSHS